MPGPFRTHPHTTGFQRGDRAGARGPLNAARFRAPAGLVQLRARFAGVPHRREDSV